MSRKKRNRNDDTVIDLERYAAFVPHPRFGREPRFTSLRPEIDATNRMYPHWSPGDGIIPNTAIEANPDRQVSATVAVTHYYDLEQQCRDCKKKYIFFAIEQQHWYEELQFGLEAGCVRCVPCRKKQRGLAGRRQQYEELFHVSKRTAEQTVTMADCCLDLIENQVFTIKQAERVRTLLNSVAGNESVEEIVTELRCRLSRQENPEGDQSS